MKAKLLAIALLLVMGSAAQASAYTTDCVVGVNYIGKSMRFYSRNYFKGANIGEVNKLLLNLVRDGSHWRGGRFRMQFECTVMGDVLFYEIRN